MSLPASDQGTTASAACRLGGLDLTRELKVSEVFYSLQGEGQRSGRPCLFIRLGGCHLACAWCDTPYTWRPGDYTAADRQPRSLLQLVTETDAYPTDLVEVTGGEPLLQPACFDLLTLLCERGKEVVLDTSGTVSAAQVDPRVHLAMDLKCPGSGMAEHNHWPNLDLLQADRDELKLVIADRGDYDWARQQIIERCLAERCPVFLSPAMPAGPIELRAWALPGQLASWLAADGLPVQLQLQLHRLLWPAAVRGREEGQHSPAGSEPAGPG